jgi:alpha-L-fucosidase
MLRRKIAKGLTMPTTIRTRPGLCRTLARLAATALALLTAAGPALAQAERDDDHRMAWWREARFGLFIHWGLYAVPAGEWDGRTNHAEWIRTTAQIPLETYDGFRERFDPTGFDADAWARMAADAGMKYIVITTKHHDGFALFDSAHTDFDIMSTPFQRDIMAELAEAARRHGLKICWYHSIMDWRHPDYLPRRGWERADRPEGDADMERYVQFLFLQVTELLTRYGDIGVMWFDGEWEATWNSEYGEALYKLCRSLQPGVIVNNRVDKGRGGMAGMSDEGYFGDFGTPEQQIPPTGLPGVDWETCMTMNDHWGYNSYDDNWKSTTELIRKLCDIAGKGGNFLLNVGPKADGTFPEESVERLRGIGAWMAVNGEAIYGTSASPFGLFEWGRCTVKHHGDRHRDVTSLYFHVFEWPSSGVLRIEGLGSEAIGARLLADPERAVGVEQIDGVTYLQVGTGAPGAHVSVVELSVRGRPIVYRTPVIEAPAGVFVGPMRVSIDAGSPPLEARYTLDGSEPTIDSPLARGPVTIDRTCTLRVRTFHDGRPVTGVVEASFERVTPAPASGEPGRSRGLRREVFAGDWNALPDFDTLEAEVVETASDAALPDRYSRERVGHVYTGMLRVESDGVYVFALTSDDGSRLLINGEVVVDNDGLHGAETATSVAALGAGWHPIRVEWFNKTGGAELGLKMAPAGEAPRAIPAESLRH